MQVLNLFSVQMHKQIFRNVRYSLYLDFILNGIIIQWFAPIHYRCELSGNHCLACGLRTAVNLLLQGRFVEAWQANHLILLADIAVLIMIGDMGSYLYWKLQNESNKVN